MDLRPRRSEIRERGNYLATKTNTKNTQNGTKLTTINLKSDVYQFIRENKINLTAWIDQQFRKEFLSVDQLQREITFYSEKLEEKKQLLRDQINRNTELRTELSSREISFMQRAIFRINNGFSPEKILQQFNTDFGRNYSFEDFSGLLNFYGKKMQNQQNFLENPKKSIKK